MHFCASGCHDIHPDFDFSIYLKIFSAEELLDKILLEIMQAKNCSKLSKPEGILSVSVPKMWKSFGIF
jgi:hypothetical protein